ncbi:hypothetical protein [Brucella pseudogrignonensis]|uniref:Uncharacterized protein n=1 Tax=Brucella pseudogrignonensis TaxID=419475 RepID=A0ABU1MEY7_9HYPH|nr:hypothetical protein [Brucella pseudogrignonensis]MDR6434620.1 hypothetical protein [Brucella pseudogrignonensis]
MPWRRFIAHKIDERKYLIVDTETGLEATVDGQTFGLMGEIQAHFGVEIMNWLEKTPVLPLEPWDDPHN